MGGPKAVHGSEAVCGGRGDRVRVSDPAADYVPQWVRAAPEMTVRAAPEMTGSAPAERSRAQRAPRWASTAANVLQTIRASWASDQLST